MRRRFAPLALPTLLVALIALPAPPAAGQDAPAADTETAIETESETEEEDLAYDRDGTYLAAGFSGGFETFASKGGRDVDDSPGFTAWLGQRLSRWGAVEVQWEWMDGFEVENVTDNNTRSADFETHALTVNGRFYPFFAVHPLEGRIQPFVKVGGGFIHVDLDSSQGKDDDDNAFVGRFGGGVEGYITPEFGLALGVDWVVPADDFNGIDYRYVSLHLGIMARF